MSTISENPLIPIGSRRRTLSRAALIHVQTLCVGVGLLVAGCGTNRSNGPDTSGLGGSATSGGSAGSGAVVGGAGGSGGTIPTTGGGASIGGAIVTGGSGGSGETCAAQKAGATLLPVRLAFAFDISGSMGEMDFPWHDPALKWEPVVAATRAFFEDPASEGIEASLTAFPIPGDDYEAKCSSENYETPTVPMTALPSEEFGRALDNAIAAGWGEGTPTLGVVGGVLSFIADSAASDPANWAFVLVTDGYPQACTDNSIEGVVNAVTAVADEIPTYVIGVANPPLTDSEGNVAPETVADLNAVAVAGGTDHAYLIDTGDPAATKAAFTHAIDEIRSVSIACNLAIPAIPDGRAFERDKVAVTHTSGTDVTDLTYDASCAAPNSWHYDDPAAPTEIVLCDEACATVQADRNAVIDVTFTCQSVIDPH